MPALALVLASVVAALGPTEAQSTGYRPSGSAAELFDVARLAKLRDPGVQPLGFSSYDRQGGNDDGFKGTYSRLRAENGNSVLAECPGPGILVRLWLTHSSAKEPGLLAGRGEHIRVYLDGQEAPALDLRLEELFEGKHPRFPAPLVGSGSGGFFCYVPIAFRDGCKVVVDGLATRFYQVGFLKLPSADGVETFAMSASNDERVGLQRAARLLSRPGDLEALELNESEPADYIVDALARSSLTYALPAGPRTLRSFEVTPTAATADAWRAVRLRLVWDRDDPDQAGVDLPLGLGMGQALGAAPYRSLLVGSSGETWYLRFPMPYRERALLRLETTARIQGTVRVVAVPAVEPGSGYFRAHSVEQRSTTAGSDFPLLFAKGSGHYAGVFLATEGRGRAPRWLEGDDRFQVDGRLALHGTGTEDYFNGGWYALEGRLDRPATYALHGFPVYSQNGQVSRVVAYRWHLSDPVSYAQQIEASLEHGGNNDVAAHYRAAVFWYSEAPNGATRSANSR